MLLASRSFPWKYSAAWANPLAYMAAEPLFFLGQQFAGFGQAAGKIIFGCFFDGAGDHLEDIHHMVAVVLVIFISFIEGSLVFDQWFPRQSKTASQDPHYCSLLLLLLPVNVFISWAEFSVPGPL